MKLARQIERRMEGALDGLAGRIFRGGLHPSELAARLARAAELAEYQTPSGPGTANDYVVSIHPGNLTGTTAEVEAELQNALFLHAAERGWRLEGPVRIRIESSPEVRLGSVRCSASVVQGPLPAWARFTRPKHPDLEIRPNRVIVGRSPDHDVILRESDVSRVHALLYRQDGETYVRDLNSANGTTVDGQAVKSRPVRLQAGSKVGFASVEFRFSLLQP